MDEPMRFEKVARFFGEVGTPKPVLFDVQRFRGLMDSLYAALESRWHSPSGPRPGDASG